MSVIAHVDHGKSTLTDSLVAAAGIMAIEQVSLAHLDRGMQQQAADACKQLLSRSL